MYDDDDNDVGGGGGDDDDNGGVGDGVVVAASIPVEGEDDGVDGMVVAVTAIVVVVLDVCVRFVVEFEDSLFKCSQNAVKLLKSIGLIISMFVELFCTLAAAALA